MSRKPDLISAIIPCYNHGDFITDAINSIVSQTYKQIEIIVVNDGSDRQGTIDILNSIDTPRTTVYHKENGGASSARNYGIKRSSGEYILTLDSDDRFEPTFAEKAFNILKDNPQTGAVTSYVRRYKGNRIAEKKLTGGTLKEFIIRNHASASLLFRYQCWVDAGGYDEEIPGYEDWDFFIGVTKNGWAIDAIPEFLFFYREIEGSNYDQHLKHSPVIIKYMANKHKKAFQNHIVEVIYEKECDILELKNSVAKYRDSVSQKVGSLLLTPFKLLKKLI